MKLEIKKLEIKTDAFMTLESLIVPGWSQSRLSEIIIKYGQTRFIKNITICIHSLNKNELSRRAETEDHYVILIM